MSGDLPVVYVKEFGCPTMKSFARTLAGKLTARGFLVLPTQDQGPLSMGGEEFRRALRASVCIFYTCGIVDFCERQIGAYMKEVVEKNPLARIVVTGCSADRFAAMPGVLLATQEEGAILRALRRWFPGRRPGVSVTRSTPVRKEEILVKSGCTKFCAYCEEPFLRRGSGTLCRYERAESIVRAVLRSQRKGAREVQLVGVCIGDWRDPLTGMRLDGLLKRILRETNVRIVGLELHPRDCTAQIRKLLSHERVGRKISVPVESGSTRVLRRMRRGYTAVQARRLLQELVREVPGISISTDIIVGFPGETEKDFLATCALVTKFPFERVYVMRYNDRPSACASSMPAKITDEVKTQRLMRLAALLKAAGRAFSLRDYTLPHVPTHR